LAARSLRVICGPTAAGKSAIALWLAQRHDAAILSADSRQVYTHFDIGTAKPTRAEQTTVPHYGLDVLEPTQRYSAAAWAEDAATWIAATTAAGRTPLIVGGTGFYLKALFAPLFQEPELDAARRESLAAYLEQLPLEELRRWCSTLDPDRADLGRTQLLRALEVALLTGQSISQWHRERERPARWTARYLLVDPGAALAARIEQRVNAMLAAGWLDEVKTLAKSVPATAPAWKASGYQALRDVVEGNATLAQARERVVIETRQYAKRQRTWFRHQLDAQVQGLDPTGADWAEVAERWWNEDEEA
jgi:tRNA dimethylallyltransferase